MEKSKENKVTVSNQATSMILLIFFYNGFIGLPGSNLKILGKSKDSFNSPGGVKQRNKNMLLHV